MNNVTTISSDEKIPDIYNHFKVIAGPGAGKTHWLVEHIRNVLQNAVTLTKTSKIACITYTTVGAEEIQRRLGAHQDKVEVSTIHSFLYANVVKPYVCHLKDSEGRMQVNVEALDGHYENVATDGKIFKWQERARNNRYINDKTKIRNCLEQLDWRLVNGSLVLRPRNDYSKKIGKYSIRDTDLYIYKQLFWEEGVIHHEDVLYFSYRLLRDYPIILDHLSAKYPFVFVDEFQDTNPIQTEIIKWMGNTHSVIGVIGDPAQSIYGFNGASREDFVSFFLPNQRTYVIEINRRSGAKIVELLNLVRNGDPLAQKAVREDSAYNVFYIENTGKPNETIQAFHELRKRLGLNRDYCIVTRQNDSVRLLRNSDAVNVWTTFHEANSADREQFVKSILTAYKLATENRNEVAIREAVRALRTNRDGILKDPFQSGQHISPIMKRSLAVDLIENMVGTMNSALDGSLFHFYEYLLEFFEVRGYRMTKISRGKLKQFSEVTTVRELVDSLVLPEEKTTEIRTIHKTKGMEFESVLVYLTEASDVERITNPNIDSEDEETRVLYVALSRAKDLLCIACPQLEPKLRNKLKSMNLIQYTVDK